MNKICTSIKQSQKLIESGIDVNTADMYYSDVPVIEWVDKTDVSKGTHVVFKSQIFAIENLREHKIGEGDIYAWSLSALMELMNRNYYNISLNCNGAEWTVKFDDSEIYHYITCDYSIDAAFEMVVWLKKNNKI